MALTPCPSCGLPRDDDAADRPCPVCGRTAGDDTPQTLTDPLCRQTTDEAIELTPAVADPVTVRNRVVVGGMLLVAVGILTVMLWDPWAKRSTADPYLIPPRAVTVVPAAPPPAPVAPSVPEVAPPPRALVAMRAVADPPFVPGLEMAPLPRSVVTLTELRVDRPTESFELPRIGEGNRVRLVGTVRKLTVGGVDGGAVLDASGLTAQEVSFSGKIDDGAMVSVRSVNGSVSIRERVVGRASLTIDAGTGYVSFPTPSEKKGGGSAIGGGSRVRITAKTVTLIGTITGADTHVVVTLAAGGSLRVKAIDGPAKLHWRQADPTAAPPKVTVETKRGNSEFKAVE